MEKTRAIKWNALPILSQWQSGIRMIAAVAVKRRRWQAARHDDLYFNIIPCRQTQCLSLNKGSEQRTRTVWK